MEHPYREPQATDAIAWPAAAFDSVVEYVGTEAHLTTRLITVAVHQAALAPSMMMSIPVIQMVAPTMSQVVGRTPSTSHSHTIATAT